MAKTEECDQKKKRKTLSDKLGIFMSGLDTYCLNVSAHALLKIASKGCFRVKKCKNLAFFWSENGGARLK